MSPYPYLCICFRNENAANDLLKESFADYDSGGYSPRYLQQNDLEPGTLVILEEDDIQRLDFARLQIMQGAGQRVEVSWYCIKFRVVVPSSRFVHNYSFLSLTECYHCRGKSFAKGST